MRPSEYGHHIFQELPEVMLYSVAGQPLMIVTLPETHPAVNTDGTDQDVLLINLVLNRLKEYQSVPGQIIIFFRNGEGNSHMVVRGYESSEINSGLTLEGIAALSVRRHLINKDANTERYSFNTSEGIIQCKVNPLTGYNFGCRLEAIPVKMIAADQEVGIPGIGLLKYDIAFVDDFYILTDAKSLGITLSPEKLMLRRMEDYGQWILGGISANHKLSHPSTNIETMPAAIVFTGIDSHPFLLQAIVNRSGVLSHSPGAGASCAKIASWHNYRNNPTSSFIVRGISGEQLSVIADEINDPSASDQETLSVNLNVTLIQSGYLFI